MSPAAFLVPLEAASQTIESAYESARTLVANEVESSVSDADGLIFSNDEEVEKLVYELHSRMRKCKANGDDLLAKEISEALATNKRLQKTRAMFDLQRDEDMRHFLGKSFDRLVRENRQNTQQLVSQMSQVVSSVRDVSSAVKESKPTRQELQEQNWDRFMDGKRFKSVFGDY